MEYHNISACDWSSFRTEHIVCYLTLLILYSTNSVIQSDMNSKLPHSTNLRVPIGTGSSECYIKFLLNWISKGLLGFRTLFRSISRAVSARRLPYTTCQCGYRALLFTPSRVLWVSKSLARLGLKVSGLKYYICKSHWIIKTIK